MRVVVRVVNVEKIKREGREEIRERMKGTLLLVPIVVRLDGLEELCAVLLR